MFRQDPIENWSRGKLVPYRCDGISAGQPTRAPNRFNGVNYSHRRSFAKSNYFGHYTSVVLGRSLPKGRIHNDRFYVDYADRNTVDSISHKRTFQKEVDYDNVLNWNTEWHKLNKDSDKNPNSGMCGELAPWLNVDSAWSKYDNPNMRLAKKERRGLNENGVFDGSKASNFDFKPAARGARSGATGSRSDPNSKDSHFEGNRGSLQEDPDRSDEINRERSRSFDKLANYRKGNERSYYLWGNTKNAKQDYSSLTDAYYAAESRTFHKAMNPDRNASEEFGTLLRQEAEGAGIIDLGEQLTKSGSFGRASSMRLQRTSSALGVTAKKLGCRTGLITQRDNGTVTKTLLQHQDPFPGELEGRLTDFQHKRPGTRPWLKSKSVRDCLKDMSLMSKNQKRAVLEEARLEEGNIMCKPEARQRRARRKPDDEDIESRRPFVGSRKWNYLRTPGIRDFSWNPNIGSREAILNPMAVALRLERNRKIHGGVEKRMDEREAFHDHLREACINPSRDAEGKRTSCEKRHWPLAVKPIDHRQPRSSRCIRKMDHYNTRW